MPVSYQIGSDLPERPSKRIRTGPSLRQRALRLLARREHSRHELIQKLTPHETVPGELAQVLDEFAAKGLIDEDRVVDMLLHRHAPRSGHMRLRQTLSQKGLTEDRIEAALANLTVSEFDRARALWQRRYGRVAQTPNEQARQARYLAGRGFAADVVRRVLKAATQEEG